MKGLNIFIVMTIAVGLLLFGCSSGEDHGEDDHMFTVTISTDPAVIAAGDTVEIELIVENQHGEHMGGLMMNGQLHLPNDTGTADLEFHGSMEDEGHYHADYVFAVAGAYELHCDFMHDGDSIEKHFDITVH